MAILLSALPLCAQPSIWWTSNVAAAVVATPAFSPGAGSYLGSQSVTISSTTSGATICYTVDGSAPAAATPGTCSAGTTYSGAVSVASSETVKALATRVGYTNSTIASAAYTITPAPTLLSHAKPAAACDLVTDCTTAAFDSRGASLLVAFVSAYDTNGAVSDNLGNTYTACTLSSVVTTVNGRFYYSTPSSTSASTTVQWHSNVGNKYESIVAAAFSTTSAAAFCSPENSLTSSSATALQTGSVTPAANGSLILAGIAYTNGVTVAIDSGFTITDQTTANRQAAMAYLVQATAAAVNPRWSWGGSSSAVAIGEVFK